MRSMLSFVLAAALVACAGAPATTDAGGAPAPETGTVTPGSGASRIDSPWPVKTRMHVDLWLHGFAMLQRDTTKVPFFRRGYVESQRTAKSRANITTSLDANGERLRARMALNRDLVHAQFLALYFGSWDEMLQGIRLFVDSEGDPRRAGTPQAQQVILLLGGYFQTAQDRDWLRLLTESLQDEANRWYRSWWSQQQRERAPIVERVDSLWNKQYRPRLQGYLNNTQQSAGDFYLSIPLDGEGRSLNVGKARSVVTVGFPERQSDAIEAVYVFVHEAASAIASQAINDNTTPAEKRTGEFDRLSSSGLVRGGEMILAKMAPDLVDGYARYYLRAAGVSASGDARAALTREFPLPEAIRSAIQRQVDIVLGGI